MSGASKRACRPHFSALLMRGAFLGAFASTAPAHAWQGNAAGPEQASQAARTASGGIADIVVTARRRSESLQNTPVAVSAITGATLADRGATDISAVAQAVPSLTFNTTAGNSGASNAAVVFIRGIGQDDFFPTIDPGVGIYLDGIYVSRTLGSVLDTVDLEQVEVLRGPQGTLFGKNTIGGAVQITTRKPSDKFEGSLEATTGRFDRIDVKGSINIPFTSSLFGRFSLATLNCDGYVTILRKDPGTGAVTEADAPKLGDISTIAGRGALRWEATPEFKLDLSFDYTRKREQSSGTTLLATQPLVPGIPVGDPNFINANAATIGGFYNLVVAGAQGCNPLAGGDAFDQSNPSCFNDQYVTGNPYTTFYDPARSRSDLDLWGLTGVAEWSVSPDVSVKSITGYRRTESHFMRDDDTPFRLLELQTDQTARQFSQELQFSGRTMDSRLTWLIGLYYFSEKVRFDNPACFSFVCTAVKTKLDTDSYAAFSQATFAIDPRTNLTAGLRYTNETKRNDPDNFYIDNGFGLPPFAVNNPNPDPATIIDNPAKVKLKNVSPMVSLDHRWSPSIMTYASFSQGIKGGGFQQRVILPRLQQPTFGPEKLTSYEIGAKTDLFDHHVRFNIAAFWADYKNLQITVFDPNFSIEPLQVNGGTARIRGIEVESTIKPFEGLTATLGGSYLDTEYTRIAPNAAIPADAVLPYTPKWSISGGLSYAYELADAGTLTLRGDWNYRSRTFFNAANDPIISQQGYHVVNLSAAFLTRDEHWRLTLGVTNLTDKAYLGSGFADLRNSSFADGVYARPREWYLSARYAF
ncbi:TonB-dependent receptor [Sphingobium indicum]|uniref:TonB-dependent receptor n=1 Tax=Sphingobium indicum TaxID=332055 RepID=A0A4Q4IYU2_9SPHN|nr:TonB-dependent receptor [Sphingobium indicum]KEY99593.1 TonB-dependent receptor [Sphingomonas sp. BHC-A]NYI24396.1 iron complex outermembrane receptor protein [Sphingobium indicum]RYL98600.1 TonB-dependent receptor [Sphingobium indicum]